jgi:hypothetical protein
VEKSDVIWRMLWQRRWERKRVREMIAFWERENRESENWELELWRKERERSDDEGIRERDEPRRVRWELGWKISSFRTRWLLQAPLNFQFCLLLLSIFFI